MCPPGVGAEAGAGSVTMRTATTPYPIWAPATRKPAALAPTTPSRRATAGADGDAGFGMARSEPEGSVLEVEELCIELEIGGRQVEVVSGVSFRVGRGRTLCLVGESGCGKSVTAMAVLGLLPPRKSRIASGAILFEGIDLVRLPERPMAAIRGRRIGMVFQEPMTSLNPTMKVGEQIAEVLRLHLGMNARAARREAIRLLDRVRIPNAARRADDYPFALSGGMRQRVMIALALACSPTLLIADEPTTALDVTVQAEILDLLRELQHESGMALLLITHDLGVVAETADEVAVMYAGRIVEQAPVAALFDWPEHPYTIGLLGAIPGLDSRELLTPIQGTVPQPGTMPVGCRFAPRCPFAIRQCREETPPLRPVGDGSRAACWRAPLDDA
jgi:peptide/nickel transport system ATP-binding protein